MQFKLFVCNDSDNVINKTLLGEQVLNITLKRDFNIYSPEIILRGDSILNIEAFNYAEIPDLERKYFIRDLQNVGYNLWRLSLETDVLETYKDDVLNSNARFRRNIKTGDYMDATIESSVKTVSTSHLSNKELSGESLILTTLGG